MNDNEMDKPTRRKVAHAVLRQLQASPGTAKIPVWRVVDVLAETDGSRTYAEREIEATRFYIKFWCKEIGIDIDWPDDLHLGDVLDNHVFPAIWEKLGNE